MFSKINTAIVMGVEGRNICVETDIASGLPNMNIVGLASTTVMEAKERIRAAIINSQFDYPRGRITVNLVPADLSKNGSILDLPIAVGLLSSTLYIDANKAISYGLLGELSLDGAVVGIDGVLPMVIAMKEAGLKKIIVPLENLEEASLVDDVELFAVNTLKECSEIINGDYMPMSIFNQPLIKRVSKLQNLDFFDIKGQENAKRAISIAVTGRHGLLMMGSPGCGKTMLAKRIPSIMPDMDNKELLQTAIIYSVAGLNNIEKSINVDRPFRSPHNSIGRAGLLGGGLYPVPGEISLAHNGVLFLDEVCEFERSNIESLRQPIEEKRIVHFRRGQQYVFPCDFQLIMAANPCKCGYYGDPEKMCTCTLNQLEQYRRKLSGPMLDRVDIQVNMERVGFNDVRASGASGKSSSDLKSDVQRGISFAIKNNRTVANACMSDREVSEACWLGDAEEKLMKQAYSSLKLSPRSYNKVLKVARTIADIEESKYIKTNHLSEALSYRMMSDERK